MNILPTRILAIAINLSAVVSCQLAAGQDSTRTLKTEGEVMTDVLNLNDPAISIWPSVNTVEIEALSSSVEDLLAAYEADRLDADERTRLIDAMIADSEEDEELIKAKIDLAKEADDDEMKKSLEDLKDLYVLRRKYLVRIGKLRDEERKLAESRIDYVSQLGDVLEIAQSLLAARENGDRAELLGTERELIRQSRELGSRLDAVAGSVKKVNAERDKAFDAREELISVDN